MEKPYLCPKGLKRAWDRIYYYVDQRFNGQLTNISNWAHGQDERYLEKAKDYVDDKLLIVDITYDSTAKAYKSTHYYSDILDAVNAGKTVLVRQGEYVNHLFWHRPSYKFFMFGNVNSYNYTGTSGSELHPALTRIMIYENSVVAYTNSMLSKNGGTVAGNIYTKDAPDNEYALVNKKYVDEAITNAIAGLTTKSGESVE